jgi:hypothetical protein
MGCRKWSRRRKRFRSCKDDGGNNQGPKIELFALSKWMCFVGRFPASVDAEKQVPSVCGVNKRMDAFRKHSGAARKRGCSKLCGCDYDIRGECPRDSLGVLESLFLLLARAEPSGPAVTERLLWDWFDRFGAEAVSLTSFEELSHPSRALRKGR